MQLLLQWRVAYIIFYSIILHIYLYKNTHIIDFGCFYLLILNLYFTWDKNHLSTCFKLHVNSVFTPTHLRNHVEVII